MTHRLGFINLNVDQEGCIAERSCSSIVAVVQLDRTVAFPQAANGDCRVSDIFVQADISFTQTKLNHGDFGTVHGELFAYWIVPDGTKTVVVHCARGVVRLGKGKAPVGRAHDIVNCHLHVRINRLSRFGSLWFRQAASTQHSNLYFQRWLASIDCGRRIFVEVLGRFGQVAATGVLAKQTVVQDERCVVGLKVQRHELTPHRPSQDGVVIGAIHASTCGTVDVKAMLKQYQN